MPAHRPAVALRQGSERIVAGGDFAFIRDASALVFVSERQGLFRVEHERVWRPSEVPLRPNIVFSEAMSELDSMGVGVLCCDAHYLALVTEWADEEEVAVVNFPGSSDGIARAYIRVRVLLGANRIDLSLASQALITELKETVGKPLAGGGMSVTHPRRAGSHGDLARSLVSAIYSLEIEGDGARDDDRQFSGSRRRFVRDLDSTDPAYMTDRPKSR